MDLEEIFQSCNNVVIEEAGNVIDEKSNHTLQYEQKHNVVLPPEEKKIAINISAIRKIRYDVLVQKRINSRMQNCGLDYLHYFLELFLVH